MDVRILPSGDVIEVVVEGQRYTFPIVELHATRRPPRSENSASSLPVSSPLQRLEAARAAAQEFAVANGLI